MMKKLSYSVLFALLFAACGENDNSAAGVEQLESLSSNTEVEYLSSSAETELSSSAKISSSSAKEIPLGESSSSKMENSSSSESAVSSSSQTKESSSSATASSSNSNNMSSDSAENSSSSEEDLSSSSEIDLSLISDDENTEGLICNEEGEKAKGLIDTSRTYYCRKEWGNMRWHNMDIHFGVVPIEEYVNKDFKYGTLIDPRDGRTYRTTEIGNQTWMAENLKFAKFTNGEADAVLENNLLNQTSCNLNEGNKIQYESECEDNGRRYSWTAAMNVSYVNQAGRVPEGEIWLEHQGVCPEGWHIPNNADWNELRSFISTREGNGDVAMSLQSIYGWGPGRLDKYGFTAFPIFVERSDNALFWSVDEYNSAKYEDRADCGYVFSLAKNSNELTAYYKQNKLYVRCIKNRGNVETINYDTTGLLSHTFERNQIFSSKAQYGSFQDERDGTVYKTVVVGDQEWFAENLNYKSIYGSSCYNNNAANCEVYGRLYKRKTAMAKQNDLYRDVCPIGWHIPSKKDWKILNDYVASQTDTPVGTALKSSVGFTSNEKSAPTGTNEFGFSAIAAGWDLSGRMSSEGVGAIFWISDRSDEAKDLLFRTETLDSLYLDKSLSFSLSVRCVKN